MCQTVLSQLFYCADCQGSYDSRPKRPGLFLAIREWHESRMVGDRVDTARCCSADDKKPNCTFPWHSKAHSWPVQSAHCVLFLFASKILCVGFFSFFTRTYQVRLVSKWLELNSRINRKRGG